MKYKANLIKKLIKTSHSNLFWSKKLLQKKKLMPQIVWLEISNLMTDKFKSQQANFEPYGWQI